MSTALEVLGTVAQWGFALGAPGAVVWYVRDRRKDQAATQVAERSVSADVEIKSLAADDARLAHADRAFEVERESYRNTIVGLHQEIHRRDERIASLLEQVRGLEVQLAEMTRQLSSVRQQLNELRTDTD